MLGIGEKQTLLQIVVPKFRNTHSSFRNPLQPTAYSLTPRRLAIVPFYGNNN